MACTASHHGRTICNKMAKMLLAMGMFVLFGEFSEFFMAWFSGDLYAQYHDGA